MRIRSKRLCWFVAATAVIVLLLAADAQLACAQGDPFAGTTDEWVSDLIGEIGMRRTRQGEPLVFTVASPSAPLPNLRIEAINLPPGATLTNLGDGYAEFSWTPVDGQEGAYYVTFQDVGPTKGPQAGEESLILVAGYPLSHGVYRCPYGNNVDFDVAQDHVTHSPPIKEDWVSVNFGPTQKIAIVAANDGRVRIIDDSNTACCADKTNGINCSACNNSVWIEHSNGEWTKYSHFQTGTVRAAPPNGGGLTEDDCVVQGQLLGYEGDVGHTSGSSTINRFQTMCSVPLVDSTKRCFIHLHWEVRGTAPTADSVRLRVPILCGITGSIAYKGDQLTAVSCDPNSCATDLVYPPATLGGTSITVAKASNSITSQRNYIGSVSRAYFAGDHITLLPGFAAHAGTYFHAMIKNCEDGPNGCPPQ